MEIGVSSYSFYQYLRSGKMTVADTVYEAARMGFASIEFIPFAVPEGDTRLGYAEKLRHCAEDAGIGISAYVTGGSLICDTPEQAQRQMDTIRSEIEVAQALGVKLFRHDVAGRLPGFMSFEQALEKTVPLIRQITRCGAEAGICTMIENHGYGFQDADRMERVYTAVNDPNFALLVDIGNFMCADEDTVSGVSRLANLAAHVHLKDFIRIPYGSAGSKEHCILTRGCNYLLGTAVGSGDVRAEQCIAVLKNAGYQGCMNIEFEGPEDCLEQLRKGLAFVKKVV